ncbi:MAG: hypothetical protein GEU90_19770 [Gemmatimonas sp.]|nr:hypothetical protein [Gemmatimonas sp.]
MNDALDTGRSSDWGEEQLRYTILQAVYDRAGRCCENIVTGAEVGGALNVRTEDLFRGIHFLEHNGYLNYLGSGPRICMTEKGLRYVEEQAARRRSIRSDGAFDLRRRR